MVNTKNSLFFDKRMIRLDLFFNGMLFPFLSQPINFTRMYVVVIKSRTKKGKTIVGFS